MTFHSPDHLLESIGRFGDLSVLYATILAKTSGHIESACQLSSRRPAKSLQETKMFMEWQQGSERPKMSTKVRITLTLVIHRTVSERIAEGSRLLQVVIKTYWNKIV